MTIPDKPAYTLNEVAELLGVSRAYVNRLVRAGKLRVARIGQRTVRVTDEALRDFLRARETTGPATYPYQHREERNQEHEETS